MSSGVAAAGRKARPLIRPHKVKQVAIDLIKKWKIVRGDLVHVISGKERGKQGVVTKVERSTNRLFVEGLNMVKKHKRPSPQTKGGIIVQEAPIHYSNVQLVDKTVGKPTRVALRYLEDGTKARVSKKTGTVIAKPAALTAKRETAKDGPKDTPPEKAIERTYFDNTAHPNLVIHRVNLPTTKQQS